MMTPILYYFLFLQLKTSFLTLIDVPDGKADTLVAALKQFMTENQLPAHSFIGLGSDGAAVMVGKKTGVRFIEFVFIRIRYYKIIIR